MPKDIATTVNYSRIVLEAIALVFIMIIMFILGAQSSLLGDGGTYECTFRNVLGEFNVTEKELYSDGSMIVVTRDERIIMFERHKLTTCILLED